LVIMTAIDCIHQTMAMPGSGLQTGLTEYGRLAELNAHLVALLNLLSRKVIACDAGDEGERPIHHQIGPRSVRRLCPQFQRGKPVHGVAGKLGHYKSRVSRLDG
jgi:hypothetical protein